MTLVAWTPAPERKLAIRAMGAERELCDRWVFNLTPEGGLHINEFYQSEEEAYGNSTSIELPERVLREVIAWLATHKTRTGDYN